MKKHFVLIVFVCFFYQAFGQTQYTFFKEKLKYHSIIGVSIDTNASYKSKTMNIALGLDKLFKHFYVRGELRYFGKSESVYCDLSFVTGAHFSFLKNFETVYLGIRGGIIPRENEPLRAIGSKFEINFY